MTTKDAPVTAEHRLMVMAGELLGGLCGWTATDKVAALTGMPPVDVFNEDMLELAQALANAVPARVGEGETVSLADWDGGFEDFAVCPHCGETDEEYCEYPRDLQHDGDTAEMSCGSCSSDYKVTICVSYSYATEPLFIGPKVNPGHLYEMRRKARDEREPDAT